MLKKSIIVFLFTTVLGLNPFFVFAADINVATPVTVTTINKAIASAKPGDTVIVPDGVYNNLANQNWPFSNRINVLVSGTKGNEITIKPATVGGITFTGTFYMVIGELGSDTKGEYIIVQDFKFEGIRSFSPSTVTVKIFDLFGDNSRITNCSFYNICQAGDKGIGHIIRNYNGSDDCEIDYCTFNKWHEQEAISPHYPKNLHIHHNYFTHPLLEDTESAIHNGCDDVRSSNNAIVEYNYFENCLGDSETISNKSKDNTYRYNVFKDGNALVLRGGSGCTVDSNFFLNTNKYGVRVHGANHKIINNYFESIAGSAAILIAEGGKNYENVDNLQVINNTIVDSSVYGIWMGYWPAGDVKPSNLYFENNVISQSSGDLIADYGHTGDFIWTNNTHYNQSTAIYWKNKGGVDEPRAGIAHTDPNLPQTNLPPISKDDVGVSWLRSSGLTPRGLTPPGNLMIK